MKDLEEEGKTSKKGGKEGVRSVLMIVGVGKKRKRRRIYSFWVTP